MSELIDSIYNKKLEIQYDEWTIKTEDKQTIKIELKGKIKCPVLNSCISSLTCSKLMSKPDWPRGIDNKVCEKNNCFINLSIERFKKSKDQNEETRQ